MFVTTLTFWFWTQNEHD